MATDIQNKPGLAGFVREIDGMIAAGRLAEARQKFGVASRNWPGHFATRNLEARLLEAEGDLEGAMAAYLKPIDVVPDDATTTPPQPQPQPQPDVQPTDVVVPLQSPADPDPGSGALRFQPQKVKVDLGVEPRDSPIESVFAFSMAKAGSTLLYRMLQGVTPHTGLKYFSADDTLFGKNVSSVRRPTSVGQAFHKTGYCYGGFRQYPAYPIGILHSSKAVLLVRDPRDMLVSLYFSLAQSHKVPESSGERGAREQIQNARHQLSSIDVNESIQYNINSYVRMFEGYVAAGFHWRKNVAIYRYEDVIFDKRAWLDELCDWYGWTVPVDVLERAAAKNDVFPATEDRSQHIRSVRPGNYKKHLTQRSIRMIESSLSEYMTAFGYL